MDRAGTAFGSSVAEASPYNDNWKPSPGATPTTRCVIPRPGTPGDLHIRRVPKVCIRQRVRPGRPAICEHPEDAGPSDHRYEDAERYRSHRESSFHGVPFLSKNMDPTRRPHDPGETPDPSGSGGSAADG